MRLPSVSFCKKVLVYVAFGALASAALIGAFYLALHTLLPFTLAWCIAFLLQPAVRLLHRHTRFSKKWVGSILILLAWTCVGVGVFFGLRALLSQLFALPAFLQSQKQSMTARLATRYLQLRQKLPFGEVQDLAQDPVWAFLSTRLSTFFSQSTHSLWETVQAWLSALPSSFFSFLIFVMATFYFTADFTRINGVLMEKLPQSVRCRIYDCKRYFVKSGVSYLRAYLILLLLTFAELLIGLTVLRVPYAAAVAFLISVLDFFPVLGVGTVLVPWSAFLLLFGNYSLGIGLLVLFGIVTLVRQIAEPHIVGAQIGLSPLATLFATYLGYRLFGFLGLLLAPLFLLLLLHIVKGDATRA